MMNKRILNYLILELLLVVESCGKSINNPKDSCEKDAVQTLYIVSYSEPLDAEESDEYGENIVLTLLYLFKTKFLFANI